jgi:hypothetical protein
MGPEDGRDEFRLKYSLERRWGMCQLRNFSQANEMHQLRQYMTVLILKNSRKIGRVIIFGV